MKRMKYYATLLHNCLLTQGSSCGKMSNALSLMELPAAGGDGGGGVERGEAARSHITV